MSRTSRTQINISHSIQYTVGGYIRLSREDGDKVESDSIINQKNKLISYINNNNEFILYDLYVDDGYTGTNFDRPDFLRMLRDIKAKKINCVVVKDLSRFGRDYIGVGQHLEQLFPQENIRFIAIDDNIDSNKGAYDMMLPFRNVFNEQYASDISKKVQSAFKTKQNNGEFIGAFTSYGYKKDPNNKNRLIIDEYPASIVRRIFKMYLNGLGKISIARQLNDDNIPCPSQYKKLSGQKYTNGQRISQTNYWTYATIHRMLHHEIYIGSMVQGKSYKPNIKIKTKMLPRDQWIIVKNTHDPIIDLQTWNAVQILLEKDTRQINFEQNISIFAGFLICGDCGRAMAKNVHKRKDGREVHLYRCGTYQRYGKKYCTPHTIKHEALEEILLSDINVIIGQITNLSTIATQLEKLFISKQKNNKHEIEKINFMLDKIIKFKKSIYEDYKEGIINLDEYKSFKEDYESQEQMHRQALSTITDTEISEYNTIVSQPWVKRLIELRQVTNLNRGIVAEIINKIKIFENNEFEIEYRYKDGIKAIRDIMKEY